MHLLQQSVYEPEIKTFMEALLLKNSLLSQGYEYVGDSGANEASTDFDQEIIGKLQDASKIAVIPVFDRGLFHLAEKEGKINGRYSFYAQFPENKLKEEEAIPSTLRGGFAVNSKGKLESLSYSYLKIAKSLPSELLFELSYSKLRIPLDKVKQFYFEAQPAPAIGAKTKELLIYLELADLLTLSSMENGNNLDYNQLRSRNATQKEREARKSLEHRLMRSPLLKKVSRTSFTLSAQALQGLYVAEVDKVFLENFEK